MIQRKTPLKRTPLNRPKIPIKKTCLKRSAKPIKKASSKRAAENRKYLKRRPFFLDGKFCPVTHTPATEIHHIRGRIGDLLLNESYWLAVSVDGHKWIHDNVNLAREKGWIK